MTEPSTPQPDGPPRSAGTQSGGVNVSGGGLSAGRDIAGRDVITGFSADAVQRLLLTVGLLVFFTAACFFSGGIVVGGAAIAALNRPVGSSLPAAQSMQNKLSELNALRAGQPFRLTFSEDELSSYIKFIAGPQLGLNNAKVRLLDEPGQLIVAGDWASLNNLQVAATFKLGTGDKSLQLESAAAQILPVGDSAFGWVALPNAVVEPAVGQIDDKLFKNVRLDSVSAVRGASQRTWTITGVKK